MVPLAIIPPKPKPNYLVKTSKIPTKIEGGENFSSTRIHSPVHGSDYTGTNINTGTSYSSIEGLVNGKKKTSHPKSNFIRTFF